MAIDFPDAHERNWNDAELLHQNARNASADQLFGVSAECGLKFLLVHFNAVHVDNAGDLTERKNRQHINVLWNLYNSLISGTMSRDYFLPIDIEPFTDWDISKRYHHRDYLSETVLISHMRGAHIVKDLMTKAKIEGLV